MGLPPVGDAAARDRIPHLVQRGAREQELHHSRRRRPGHGARRRAAVVTHHRARMGTRHDGAAGIDARDRTGGHAGQTHPVLPDRALRCRILRGDRHRLVPGALSAARWRRCLSPQSFPRRRPGIGYLISVAIRSQLGASQIAFLLTMLPMNAAVGLRLSDRPDARADTGRHLPRVGTLLCDHSQGGVPEGLGAGAGGADVGADALCRGHGNFCDAGLPQDAGSYRVRAHLPHSHQGVHRAEPRQVRADSARGAAAHPDGDFWLRRDLRGLQRRDRPDGS